MFGKNLRLGFVLAFCPMLTIAQEVGHAPGTYKFLENKNQWPDHLHYRANVQGGHILLEKYGILYQFNNFGHNHLDVFEGKEETHSEALQEWMYAYFIGANVDFETRHSQPSREYYNFFLGNDKTRWAQNVYGYGEIEYINLYDEIDLKFFESEGQLKYEYTVHPGGNPADINVQYLGFDELNKTKDGSVIMKTSLGMIVE